MEKKDFARTVVVPDEINFSLNNLKDFEGWDVGRFKCSQEQLIEIPEPKQGKCLVNFRYLDWYCYPSEINEKYLEGDDAFLSPTILALLNFSDSEFSKKYPNFTLWRNPTSRAPYDWCGIFFWHNHCGGRIFTKKVLMREVYSELRRGYWVATVKTSSSETWSTPRRLRSLHN